MTEIGAAKPRAGGQRCIVPMDKLQAKWSRSALQSLRWAERFRISQATSSKRNGRDRHCKASGGRQRSPVPSDKLRAKWPRSALQSLGRASRDPFCQPTRSERNGRDRRWKASGGQAEILSAKRQAPSEMVGIGIAKPKVGGERSPLPNDRLRAKWPRSALLSLGRAGRDRHCQTTSSKRNGRNRRCKASGEQAEILSAKR